MTVGMLVGISYGPYIYVRPHCSGAKEEGILRNVCCVYQTYRKNTYVSVACFRLEVPIGVGRLTFVFMLVACIFATVLCMPLTRTWYDVVALLYLVVVNGVEVKIHSISTL